MTEPAHCRQVTEIIGATQTESLTVIHFKAGVKHAMTEVTGPLLAVSNLETRMVTQSYAGVHAKRDLWLHFVLYCYIGTLFAELWTQTELFLSTRD